VVGQSLYTCFDDGFICTDTPDPSSPDFGQPLPNTSWCLMELPPDHIESLEGGEEFRFLSHSASNTSKGKAAVCTGTATSSLEFLENSNTLLLGEIFSGSEAPKSDTLVDDSVKGDGLEEAAQLERSRPVGPYCKIFAQCRGHLMLKPEAPDSQHLHQVMVSSAQTTESAPEESAASPPLKLTTTALEHCVAGSSAEIRKLLEAGPYYEHEGAWHWLSPSVEQEIIQAVIAARGSNANAVDCNVLLEEVQRQLGPGECPLVSTGMLKKVLRNVAGAPTSAAENPEGKEAAAEVSTSNVEAEGQTVSLDAAKVQRLNVLKLLREEPAQVRDRFNLPAPPPKAKRSRLSGHNASSAGGREAPLLFTEFVTVFRELSDEDITEEDVQRFLNDHAFIDPIDKAVHPLDITALPQNPRSRLKTLFELQSHWTSGRLGELLKPVLAGIKIEDWLIKNTKIVFIEIDGKEERLMMKKFGGIC